MPEALQKRVRAVLRRRRKFVRRAAAIAVGALLAALCGYYLTGPWRELCRAASGVMKLAVGG